MKYYLPRAIISLRAVSSCLDLLKKPKKTPKRSRIVRLNIKSRLKPGSEIFPERTCEMNVLDDFSQGFGALERLGLPKKSAPQTKPTLHRKGLRQSHQDAQTIGDRLGLSVPVCISFPSLKVLRKTPLLTIQKPAAWKEGT